jgi:hypothetical protein
VLPSSLMRNSRKIWAGVVAVAAVIVCAGGIAWAQSVSAVHGKVVDAQGAPIPDVIISGSRDPSGEGSTSVAKTDAQGNFTLTFPGKVMHFLKVGYEPQMVVISARATGQQYVLQAASNDFVLKPCEKLPSHDKAFGDNELRFSANPKDFVSATPLPDADFLKFGLQPKGDTNALEIWLGHFAMDIEPEDELLILAESFSSRSIVAPGKGTVGIDTTGVRSGKRWRHWAISGRGGAFYQSATEPEARVFDDVIATACGDLEGQAKEKKSRERAMPQ